MKKMILPVSIAIFALVFTSCRKDYTCTCTTTTSTTTETSIYTYRYMKKEDAERACKSIKPVFLDSFNNITTHCSL